jgi:hypothetical protein
VAEPLPFSESELGLLSSLLKHKVRFMVVGLSAATLQGAPVVTQDVARFLFRCQRDEWVQRGRAPRGQQAADESHHQTDRQGQEHELHRRLHW